MVVKFIGAAKGLPTMDCATRLRIATGSAKGLAYIHEDCKNLMHFFFFFFKLYLFNFFLIFILFRSSSNYPSRYQIC